MHGEMTYSVNGKVVVRTIGEDILLVPVEGPAAGARVYPVNETARVVWSVLAGGGTVDQAAAALGDRFAVSEEEARADAEDCARMFLEEELLEEHSR